MLFYSNALYALFPAGKPIFSIDIHPDGSKFATGGQGKFLYKTLLKRLLLKIFVLQQGMILDVLLYGMLHRLLKSRQKKMIMFQNYFAKWTITLVYIFV
jgi:hypothetical protein